MEIRQHKTKLLERGNYSPKNESNSSVEDVGVQTTDHTIQNLAELYIYL